MIRVAKKKIRNTRGLSPIAVAQAQALPFKNDSFDTVISIFPSAYIQYRGIWREAKRVLTTDGTFVCLIWLKMEPGTLRAIVQRIIYGTNDPEFQSLIHLAGIEGFGTRIEKIPDREGNVMFVLLSREAPLNRES